MQKTVWEWEKPFGRMYTAEALVGFQGRECADGVQPVFVPLSALKPLFFYSLKNELCFSDNMGASDPGIQEERQNIARVLGCAEMSEICRPIVYDVMLPLARTAAVHVLHACW